MARTVVILVLLLTGCTENSGQTTVTGMIPVPGGDVFYEMSNPEATGIPLLLIHGGPGGTSCSFGLLDDLITDRPVIRYDQLETGLSDRPGIRSQWVISHFVEEIEAIREALHLDELHLLGSSWGGSVATEYALEGNVDGLLSVILAGPLLSTPRWLVDAEILISQMPEELQETIRRNETVKTYSNRDYIAATDSFYARYLFHQPRKNIPECDGVQGNDEVYNTMWGPTEFTSTGTLLTYDRTERLHEISVPVLLVVGEFDEARPETMFEFAELIPDAQVEIVADAGHVAMADKPEEYAALVSAYLAEIEARQ